jgi:hypothetical protein
MRSTPDDSQIRLFDFDELKPKIELGQSFERVGDAAKQGLIPPYDFQSPEGIPFWLLVTASEFKRRHRDDCCDLYAKKGSTDFVDSAQVPVELACLALYKNINFCRSTKAVDDGAIIVSIGSGPGSLKQAIIDSGQAISQSQSVRRVLTAKALIDYLGIGGHPFFGEQDQRSDLEIKVDGRILRACARPITGTDLRSKARGNGDEERNLYPVRIEYLVQQEKLYTWKERRVNYYCVTPPPDEPEPGPAVVEADVDVEAVGQVEIEDQSGAIVPSANTLAGPVMVQDFYLDQHDHEFLEHFKNPDERMFLAVCTIAAKKIGRPIEWVEFGERLWLTVKQSASLLGMDERTVRHHLQQFPFEMSVLSEKLTGDRLDAYKQYYPSNPPEPHQSDWCGSGGLNEKAVHEHSSHFILISPAGVTWLAKASETRPAKAIIKEFMMKADKVAPIMEQMGAKSRTALSQKDRDVVELLVELRDGDKKIISLLEVLVESRNRTDQEIILLLRTMAPAAARTEQGVGEVREIVNEINRNTNSPRREFLPEAISGAIKAFLYITQDTGRDVIDQTLLIDADGSKTKDCELDHIRSRSDRSAQNCMPLSKATHRKKTHGQLTPEEKATLERAEKALEHYWAQKSQIEPYQPGLSLDTQL